MTVKIFNKILPYNWKADTICKTKLFLEKKCDQDFNTELFWK